jgi:hypothetical protein
MELLKLTGLEAPCFINFDNVSCFYIRQVEIGKNPFYFTDIKINKTHFHVKEKPETILFSLKKNKFIEFENEDFFSEEEDDNWEMANGKFYVNINSIEMVDEFQNETSLLYIKKSFIEVKGTVESIYLKLNNLK